MELDLAGFFDEGADEGFGVAVDGGYDGGRDGLGESGVCDLGFFGRGVLVGLFGGGGVKMGVVWCAVLWFGGLEEGGRKEGRREEEEEATRTLRTVSFFSLTRRYMS